MTPQETQKTKPDPRSTEIPADKHKAQYPKPAPAPAKKAKTAKVEDNADDMFDNVPV